MISSTVIGRRPGDARSIRTIALPEHAANGRDDGGRAASASVTAFVIGIERAPLLMLKPALATAISWGSGQDPKAMFVKDCCSTH